MNVFSYALYRASLLTKSKILIKILFDIDIKLIERFSAWDLVTLFLFREISKLDLSQKIVADFGCGEGCFLSIAAIKSNAKNVVAYDIDEIAVSNANKNIEGKYYNDLITIIQKDITLIKNNKYDFIIFNPPFIPKDWYQNNCVVKSNSIMWDGGKNGTEITLLFLKSAINNLTVQGVILFGFFTFSKSNYNSILNFLNSYNITVISKRLILGCIYILKITSEKQHNNAINPTKNVCGCL